MGPCGLPFPEEYGGMGGDYFALCLAIEQLAGIDQHGYQPMEKRVGMTLHPSAQPSQLA